MEFDHAPKIDRAEHIDIMQEKWRVCFARSVRLLKEPGGFLEASSGVEQGCFARHFDVHAETIVRLQVLEDHLGMVMNGDYHFADSNTSQAGKRDLKQGSAVHLNQRFRTIIG